MHNATEFIQLAVQPPSSLIEVSPSPSHSALPPTSLVLGLIGLSLLSRLWTMIQFRRFYIFNIFTKIKYQVLCNFGPVPRDLGFVGPAEALSAVVQVSHFRRDSRSIPAPIYLSHGVNFFVSNPRFCLFIFPSFILGALSIHFGCISFS